MADWTARHEKRRQEILRLLSRKAKPFADVSDEAKAARRKLAFLDWCVTYLPHYFDKPFAPFHAEMAGAAGEPGMPTFICAFRGAGKSVLLTLARALYRTLNREVPYWLYGARVQLLAAQNMDYVRLELEHNDRIRCDYGELRPEGDENEWTVDLREAPAPKGKFGYGATKLEAFGIGMSPRGKRFIEHRPLEFVGDDLEDAELARNPQREQKLWDWMMDEVMPALEPERYIFTVLGTTFGPDCMMKRAELLAKKQDETGRPLARAYSRPATDEAGRSVWPDRFPDVELSRIRDIIGLRNWMRNYALLAEDPSRSFQAGWFDNRYALGEVRPQDLDVVAFLDPAISQAPTGCPRALICIGCDRKTGERYALDAWIARGTPREMIDKLFAFHRRWRPRVIGVETNGGYALIRPLLRNEEERRGYALPVRYISHSRPKDLRIETLCPEMETGRWRWPEHPSEGIRTLIQQFLGYPNGYIDGPDATAGCTEMLPDAWAPSSGEWEHKSLRKRRDLAALV